LERFAYLTQWGQELLSRPSLSRKDRSDFELLSNYLIHMKSKYQVGETFLFGGRGPGRGRGRAATIEASKRATNAPIPKSVVRFFHIIANKLLYGRDPVVQCVEGGGKLDTPSAGHPSHTMSLNEYSTLITKVDVLCEFFNSSDHDVLVIIGEGGSGKTYAINAAVREYPHPPLTVYHDPISDEPCSFPSSVSATVKEPGPKTIHCLWNSDSLESLVSGYSPRSRVQTVVFRHGTE